MPSYQLGRDVFLNFSPPHYGLLLALRKVGVLGSWEVALADALKRSHQGEGVVKNDTRLEKPLFLSFLQLIIPALCLGSCGFL